MPFIDKVLQEPGYGWSNSHGELVVPSTQQLFDKAFRRINIFESRKNWISVCNWIVTIVMLPLFLMFVLVFFQLKFLLFAVLYGLVIMAVHSTVWHHRYCAHKAFTFSHPLWRIVTQHLAIRTFPEEIFVVSHHVHHAKSDKPGDPYNSKAGFMYCMLADVNHQSISKTLNQSEYAKAASMLRHVGCPLNSFAQYQRWGSITHPAYVVAVCLINWIIWYVIFYVVDGHGLACAAFTGAMFWFILVRAFNYTGHGGGKPRHVEGVDFDRRNLSINQVRPGMLCGEWHNNHHLYPGSARCGFLPHQLDLAWIFIFALFKIGAISHYRDARQEFLRKYVNSKPTRAVTASGKHL
jgi:stearoyl-CoA desaturase (delta-9 desaturase)